MDALHKTGNASMVCRRLLRMLNPPYAFCVARNRETTDEQPIDTIFVKMIDGRSAKCPKTETRIRY